MDLCSKTFSINEDIINNGKRAIFFLVNKYNYIKAVTINYN